MTETDTERERGNILSFSSPLSVTKSPSRCAGNSHSVADDDNDDHDDGDSYDDDNDHDEDDDGDGAGDVDE